MVSVSHPQTSSPRRWHEIYAAEGVPRPLYDRLLPHLLELPPASRRTLREQMAATLREMGMSLSHAQGPHAEARGWTCDLLPQIFAGAEWDRIVSGFRQRLRAWEMFLEDVYNGRSILRAGVVPVHAVLASPNYHGVAKSLPRPRNSFLHLCGLCLARDAGGTLVVKQHFFARAEGISFMVQNRRALARVAPELFSGMPVHSVAEAAVLIMEHFRATAQGLRRDEPRVVLLAPSSTTAAPQLSFLARRMGIAMVQGGDLIVLDDHVYLKTVRGLEQIDVIYNCVANEWLDPLVFRRESREGVPGLVHCLRKGTVALVNALGSELADDATLLPYATQIIRYYLNEAPILPSTPTLWLGDLDQREMALENRAAWRIRRVGYQARAADDHYLASDRDAEFVNQVRREPGRYVAQPRSAEAATVCFTEPRVTECHQDHIVYAVRTGPEFEVLPGALTRVHKCDEPSDAPDWNSKDTWVLSDPDSTYVPPRCPRRQHDTAVPTRQVMSRTADSFYWMGRYLERAYHQAYLISAIGTLETEELNSAERKHYQPIWNRLLPPLEKSAGTSRRAITNWLDRYRLVLLPQPGSIFRTLQRALLNAETMRDSISPEAWTALNELQTIYRKVVYQPKIGESTAFRITRRMSDLTTHLIPQFFAIAANTMLEDDGWRFCRTGLMLERAIITANSTVSLGNSVLSDAVTVPQNEEIELSAFLRLLGTRDAYRRIYQTRAEAVHVMELLWQHPEVPRSVLYCVMKCRDLLRLSSGSDPEGGASALTAVEDLVHRLIRVNWSDLVPSFEDDEEPLEPPATRRRIARPGQFAAMQAELQSALMNLHTLISDGFFSHQSRIGGAAQPMLKGFAR